MTHGDRAFSLICSILLFIGVLLYYTIFYYRLYYFALVAIILLHFLVHSKNLSGWRTLTPLGVFIAFQSLSSFWSPQRSDGLGQSGLDLVFVMFSVIPLMYNDLKKKYQSLSLVKSYAFAMIACIAINWFAIGEIIDTEKGAFRSIFAASFVMAIPVLVGEALMEKRKLSFVALVTIMLLGFELESRLFTLFSVPLLIATLAVCLITEGRRLQIALPVTILLGLLTILAIVQVVGVSGLLEQSRFGSADTLLAFGDSVYSEAASNAASVDIERRLVTQVSLDSFRLSPIIGTGYMSTAYYVGLLTRYETVAHGLPTELLAETGLIGTTLFVIVCIVAVRGYLLRTKLCAAAEKRWIYIELLTFVAVIIVGLFHQANHDFALYLLIGGGLAGRRLISIEPSAGLTPRAIERS